MEKLVLIYHWGDEGCCGTSHIAFEYESKDKFVFDVLEKYKDKEWEIYNKGKSWQSHEKVEVIPNVYLEKSEIDSIEHSVFTLDAWFEYQKIEVTI